MSIKAKLQAARSGQKAAAQAARDQEAARASAPKAAPVQKKTDNGARARLEALKLGAARPDTGCPATLDAQPSANERHHRHAKVLLSPEGVGRNKPSALGPEVPKADRHTQVGIIGVVMERQPGRVVRGSANRAPGSRSRSSPPRSRDRQRSAVRRPTARIRWPVSSQPLAIAPRAVSGRTPDSRGARHWPAARNGGCGGNPTAARGAGSGG